MYVASNRLSNFERYQKCLFKKTLQQRTGLTLSTFFLFNANMYLGRDTIMDTIQLQTRELSTPLPQQRFGWATLSLT